MTIKMCNNDSVHLMLCTGPQACYILFVGYVGRNRWPRVNYNNSMPISDSHRADEKSGCQSVSRIKI